MYKVLAKFYDGLVKDDSATQSWVSLITQHITKKNIMELACGSGEITLALAKEGYQIDASDISKEMLEEAKQKDKDHSVHYYQMDMTQFHHDKQYDGIICLCDSINYILKDEELSSLFEKIYQALVPSGVFIFDVHSLDRLIEFEEEFYEEGVVGGQQYTWSILTIDDCLHHNFIFYDEDANYRQEQHIQKVYEPSKIEQWLSPYFVFDVKTDFDLEGIQEGEKYFYICRKKE